MEEVKKGKKKNKVASLLLALALILTCGVAGTIAQYQKSFNGNATASVAKFQVSAGTLQDNTTNLFAQREDTGTHADGTESVASGKIAPGTRGQMKIDLKNDSEVKVRYKIDAELTDGTLVGTYDNVTYDSTTGKMPLKFALSTDGTYPESTDSAWKDWDDIKASLNDTSANAQVLKIGSDNTASKYLCWQWAIGSDSTTDQNRLDTAIGLAMQNYNTVTAQGTYTENSDTVTFKAPKVTVSVTFTQVD